MTNNDNVRYDNLVKDGLAHVCCGGKDGKPIHERHYYDRMMTCPICYPDVPHYKILNKPKAIKNNIPMKKNNILDMVNKGFIIKPTYPKPPITEHSSSRPLAKNAKAKSSWRENIGWVIIILVVLYLLINFNAIISYLEV